MTRLAPSPTGLPHIVTALQAVVNRAVLLDLLVDLDECVVSERVGDTLERHAADGTVGERLDDLPRFDDGPGGQERRRMLVDRLLRAGAEPHPENRYGTTPIALACESGPLKAES